MESEDLRFRKSSFSSNGGGNCVEIGFQTSAVAVRNSRDQDGPVLYFTADEWRAFIAGVRNGEFDWDLVFGRLINNTAIDLLDGVVVLGCVMPAELKLVAIGKYNQDLCPGMATVTHRGVSPARSNDAHDRLECRRSFQRTFQT